MVPAQEGLERNWSACLNGYRFWSTVALTAGRDVTQLDVSIVSNLLIQCSDTTIASYLTSVIADIHTYADLETKIIAKYGKHHRQVMWEIIELA